MHTIEREEQEYIINCIGDLNAREMKVLELIANGYTDEGIGRHLHTSTKSAAGTVGRIYFKLGVDKIMYPKLSPRVLAARAFLIYKMRETPF